MSSSWSVNNEMYEVIGITHKGHVRTNNEDSFMLNQEIVINGSLEKVLAAPFLAAVADGMGGQNAGEVAANIALEELANEPLPATEMEIRQRLEQEIQQKLYSYMRENAATSGMGATIAGILVGEAEETLIFHIGDSRVYRYRDGFLKALTSDHSLVEMLFQTGQITYEEKRQHPKRHIVLRSLGQKDVKADIKGLSQPHEKEDVFLICSDGLSDLVTEEEIEDILHPGTKKSLREQGEALIAAALEQGGTDNITIILVKMK